MKRRVADLDGVLLDVAVAKASGYDWRIEDAASSVLGVPLVFARPVGEEEVFFQPSNDWCDGGPIIQSQRISVSYDDQRGEERGMWNAYVHECPLMMQSFNSALIAAMRAFVASKLGEEVDLP